jgi:hypothetical protein
MHAKERAHLLKNCWREGCNFATKWLLAITIIHHHYSRERSKERTIRYFAVGYILSSDYTIVLCVCVCVYGAVTLSENSLIAKKKHFISFENLTMQQQSLVENSIKVTLN